AATTYSPSKNNLLYSTLCIYPLTDTAVSTFFFQAEDGIRDRNVTGVQTCALPICPVAVPRCPLRPCAPATWVRRRPGRPAGNGGRGSPAGGGSHRHSTGFLRGELSGKGRTNGVIYTLLGAVPVARPHSGKPHVFTFSTLIRDI